MLALSLHGDIPMANNVVLRPQRDFGAVRSSLVLGAAVLWCSSQFSGAWRSSSLVVEQCSGAVCAGKKCACHLIGTQATDIVSRDEQWPHTSPTHYLSLLFYLLHVSLFPLTSMYTPDTSSLGDPDGKCTSSSSSRNAPPAIPAMEGI